MGEVREGRREVSHVGRRTQEKRLAWCVFVGQGGVTADICTAHGHLWWFIYPRPPDQASDLPEFVRLEGAPHHTTQFLTFHISSHFQLPVSLYHWTQPGTGQPTSRQMEKQDDGCQNSRKAYGHHSMSSHRRRVMLWCEMRSYQQNRWAEILNQ